MIGMSDHAKTMLQETGSVNVQGLTVADIVEGLTTLGIDLRDARVHNLMGVRLVVRESQNQDSVQEES